MAHPVNLSLRQFLGGGLWLGQEQGLSEADAIAKLKAAGGLVLEIAQNDNRLDVSFLSAQGKVTDELIAPVQFIPRLAQLNLRGTEVTDAGLVAVGKAVSLVRLHLEKTKVTDAGVANLKTLVNLEYLNLYGTELSDAGLAHLSGLAKLKTLYVWQTKVTDAGVMALQQALPMLKIVRGT